LSKTINSAATFKLTDLLGMIFDDELFEHPTNDPNNENFRTPVRHQNGIAPGVATADAAHPLHRRPVETGAGWRLTMQTIQISNPVCQQNPNRLCHADVLRRHRQRHECEQEPSPK
jgi:hypothetical protein